jgi:hypothetical protein
MVVSKACYSIATRSKGTPGGAAIGRLREPATYIGDIIKDEWSVTAL